MTTTTSTRMARFNMGSTVIMLLPPRVATWDPALGALSPVKVCQSLGRLGNG